MTSTNSKVAVLVTNAVAAFARAEESDRERLLMCAAATFAVTDAGLIGPDMSGKGGWESQKDYAAKFVSSQTGKAVSASTVTMWRRIGRAMSLGVTPDGPTAPKRITRNGSPVTTFDLLTRVANRKDVGKALDEGTRTAIVNAVHGQFGKTGELLPQPKSSTDETAGNGGTGGTDGNTPDVPQTRNNSTTLDALETVAARLTSTLTKAEAKRLGEFIASLEARLAPAEKAEEAA